MEKNDLILDDIEIAKFPLPDHKHTLRDMKRNIANYASLKTTRAIIKALNENGCMGECVHVVVELESIVRELEKEHV